MQSSNSPHLIKLPTTLYLQHHRLLNLRDSLCRVKTLWARPATVENGVTSVQTHAVVQGILALLCALVTRVGQPAVRLKEDSRSEVLFAVPPV